MSSGAYRDKAFRKIALAGIERQCHWLKASSEQLTHYVGMLEDRPSFETLAEDAMRETEKALTRALVDVGMALTKFRELKVESDNGESKKGSEIGL